MSTIKIRRGLKTNVPASTLAGELLFTMDSKELFVGNGAGVPNTTLVRKNNYDATVAPTALNDSTQSYSVGSIWVDVTGKKYYSAVDVSVGAAVWVNCTGTAPASGNLTETTSSVLTLTGGTGAVLGAGTTIQVKQASASQSGYLSSTDWSTFNGKQDALGFIPEPALTKGNLTETTSSVLTVSGGTSAVIGSGTTIQVKQASTSQSGYLSSTDWNTFNGKSVVTSSTTNGNIKVNGSELTVFTAVKDNFVATIAPTVSNDSTQGYSVGSTWVDIVAQRQYTCINAAVGAAVWLLVASASGVPTPKISIQGCRLRHISATQVNVAVGAINLYGVSYEISSEIPITWTNLASGSAKAANTWYFCYLNLVGSTITPYISTAQPNRDAYGNTVTDPSIVSAKYHSTHGRFVGTFKTDASQNIINFVSLGNWVQYIGQGYNYILQGGNATSRTPVNCRGLVPYTSSICATYFESAGGNGNKYVGDDVANVITFIAGGTGEITLPVRNDSVYYQVQNTGNSCSLGVHGYFEET